MISKEEMIKGLDALSDLIKEQNQLRRDGLIFIFEKGMWKEFMKYHYEKTLERMSKKGGQDG